ncbi:hypothetical protein WA577_007848, partial [Blastocystis sp. JDR]
MESGNSMEEARARLVQRFGSGNRKGGKNMQRRTRKVFHSEQNELEKWRALARSLEASPLPDIQEANFICNNCKVFHFVNPTVCCSVTSNATFLFGKPSVNDLESFFPDILPQLGEEILRASLHVVDAMEREE